MKRTFAATLIIVIISSGFCYCTNLTGKETSQPEQTLIADAAINSLQENMGTTWTPVALNNDDETVSAFLNVKGKRIVAGTSAGIYLSDDFGKTWSLVGAGLPQGKSVYAIGTTPEGSLLAGVSHSGIYLLQ